MTAADKYQERDLNPQDIHVPVEVMSPCTWGVPLGQTPLHYIRYPDATGILSGGVSLELVELAMSVLDGAVGFDANDLALLRAKLMQTIPGREYIITDAQLKMHFEMLPQTLRVQAWGGVYERPMKVQREAEDAAAALRDTIPEEVP